MCGLKPISELCNLSLFTSAEGEYSAAVQITQPLNSFVWLASIQACEACPTQSTAIVRLKMLQQLSDRLLYYMAISPSLQRSLSHFMLFLVLMCEPLIRLQLDDSPPYFSCLSFPCFPLLLPSPSAIPYYAVLSLIFLMTLSCSLHSLTHNLPFATLSVCCLFCVPSHFAPLMFRGARTLTGDTEVHSQRREPPGATSRNHRLYNMPVSPGWGLKPQQRGIIFFQKTLTTWFTSAGC